MDSVCLYAPFDKTNGIYVSVPTALWCCCAEGLLRGESESFCIKKEISVKVRHSQVTERCSGKRVIVKVVVMLQQVTCTQTCLVVSTRQQPFDPRLDCFCLVLLDPRVRQQAHSKLGLKRKSMDEEGPNGSRDKKVLGKKRPAGMWCHHELCPLNHPA